MMKRRYGSRNVWRAVVSFVSMVVFAPATLTLAQEPPSDGVAGDASTLAASELPLMERLALLTPSDPEGYFLRGEDAADEGNRKLATHLLVLAAHLDADRFGRSACLALAEMARRAGEVDDADRLAATARMYPAPVGRTEPPLSERDVLGKKRAAAMASAVLGFYRQGEGQRAQRTISRHDQSLELLRRYGSSLGSVARILGYCETNPRCEMCKNERVIKCPSCHGGADPGICSLCHGQYFLVCRSCDGHPGPNLSDPEIDTMLQFETGLLAGRGATWAAQFQLDGGRARPLFDPSQLAETLGIDVTRTVYRNGAWQRPGP